MLSQMSDYPLTVHSPYFIRWRTVVSLGTPIGKNGNEEKFKFCYFDVFHITTVTVPGLDVKHHKQEDNVEVTSLKNLL